MRRLLTVLFVFTSAAVVSGCTTGRRECIGDDCPTDPPVKQETVVSFKQLYEWKSGSGGFSPSIVYYPRGGTDADVNLTVAFFEEATASAENKIHVLRMVGKDTLVVRDETVVSSTEEIGSSLALVLQNDGKLALAYQDKQQLELKLMLEKSEGDWQKITVDGQGNVGHFVDMAADRSGGIHIAYLDLGEKDLKYALVQNGEVLIGPQLVDSGIDRDGDNIQPGGNVEGRLAITVDPLGDPTISYYEAINGQLRMAHFNSVANAWHLEVLGQRTVGNLVFPDSSGKIKMTSPFVRRIEQLELLADGLPVTSGVHISGNMIEVPSYRPGAEYELSYTRPFSANYGQWSDLKYDGLGVLHVALFDFQRQLLALASNADPFVNRTWDLSIVDDEGSVGDFCGLTVAKVGTSGGGIPVIAYYDAGNADLRLAFRASGAWNRSQAIDTAGWNGLNIAIDSAEDGFVAVAYRAYDYDTGFSSLRILRTIPVVHR